MTMEDHGRAPERCANCRFYVGQECRRYPPTKYPGTFGGISEWHHPPVNGDGWCGEWVADQDELQRWHDEYISQHIQKSAWYQRMQALMFPRGGR